MTMTPRTNRCRRCGADATRTQDGFERRLDFGRGEPAPELLRLCGPCSTDLADDEHRVEYLRLVAMV